MVQFDEIARKVQAARPSDDIALLRKAYEFTADEHKSQTRLSGEPFVSHPLEVANVLAGTKGPPPWAQNDKADKAEAVAKDAESHGRGVPAHGNGGNNGKKP